MRIGSKVRVKDDGPWLGLTGEVVNIWPSLNAPFAVRLDGRGYSVCFAEDELQLAAPSEPRRPWTIRAFRANHLSLGIAWDNGPSGRYWYIDLPFLCVEICRRGRF